MKLEKETSGKLENLEELVQGKERFYRGIFRGDRFFTGALPGQDFQGKEKAIGVISNSESLKSKDFELAQIFQQTI